MAIKFGRPIESRALINGSNARTAVAAMPGGMVTTWKDPK